MKKRLALLCALMLLVQLVTVPGLLAGAEEITTPSDLPHLHSGTITTRSTGISAMNAERISTGAGIFHYVRIWMFAVFALPKA